MYLQLKFLYLVFMKAKAKKNTIHEDLFDKDYRNIVGSEISIKNEWLKSGDLFQKFTMYNNNYRIVPNLESIGSTTLIKKL